MGPIGPVGMKYLMGWVGWYKNYSFDLIQQFKGRMSLLENWIWNLKTLRNFELKFMNFHEICC